MNKLKEWTEKLKSKKSLPLVIAAVLAVMVLFIVCVGGSFDKTSDEPASAQSYIDDLQNKLVSVIQKIDGCGRAEVAVVASTEGGCEYAYETKSQTDGDKTTQTTSIVLVKGQPLVTKTYTPQVSGVVVVAEGADNPVVKFEIINLVVTLTGVDRDNVRVFAYKV